jgi:hypothetical protein
MDHYIVVDLVGPMFRYGFTNLIVFFLVVAYCEVIHIGWLG